MRDYADNPASTAGPDKEASETVMTIFAALDEFELDCERKEAANSRDGAD